MNFNVKSWSKVKLIKNIALDNLYIRNRISRFRRALGVGSIPILYQLIFNANWNVSDLPKESNLSIILVGFFMTYCIMDILIGRFSYKNEISNSTSMKGYLHHLVYLVISSFVIYKQRTEIFCLMSIFEV